MSNLLSHQTALLISPASDVEYMYVWPWSSIDVCVEIRSNPVRRMRVVAMLAALQARTWHPIATTQMEVMADQDPFEIINKNSSVHEGSRSKELRINLSTKYFNLSCVWFWVSESWSASNAIVSDGHAVANRYQLANGNTSYYTGIPRSNIYELRLSCLYNVDAVYAL